MGAEQRERGEERGEVSYFFNISLLPSQKCKAGKKGRGREREREIPILLLLDPAWGKCVVVLYLVSHITKKSFIYI